MTCHYKRVCTQHGSVLLPETFEQLGPQACTGIDASGVSSPSEPTSFNCTWCISLSQYPLCRHKLMCPSISVRPRIAT